jgi:hypothetical protein
MDRKAVLSPLIHARFHRKTPEKQALRLPSLGYLSCFFHYLTSFTGTLQGFVPDIHIFELAADVGIVD